MVRPSSGPRIADVADALREGLSRGYLGVPDAIEWAQREAVADHESLDPLVPYLAVSGHRPTSHILLILAQLAWGADAPRVGRIAAGQLHDALSSDRLNARSTVHAVYRLFRDGYAPDADFERAARRFDDEIERVDRGDAPADELRGRLLAFLDRYHRDSAPGDADAEPALDSRDRLTVTADSGASDSLEINAQLTWQGWSGRARLSVARERLAEFATELRDFAAHHTNSVRLDERDKATGSQFELTVAEFGRARRAAVQVRLAHGTRSAEVAPPGRLEVSVPTEHELVGDFAADIAELVAAGSGVAQLRLLRRWVDEL
jgi:hypothetical protein